MTYNFNGIELPVTEFTHTVGNYTFDVMTFEYPLGTRIKGHLRYGGYTGLYFGQEPDTTGFDNLTDFIFNSTFVPISVLLTNLDKGYVGVWKSSLEECRQAIFDYFDAMIPDTWDPLSVGVDSFEGTIWGAFDTNLVVQTDFKKVLVGYTNGIPYYTIAPSSQRSFYYLFKFKEKKCCELDFKPIYKLLGGLKWKNNCNF